MFTPNDRKSKREQVLNSTFTTRMLHEAVKRVPALKYAIGVVGIVCSISIIKAMGVDMRVAALGVVVMLVLMVALLVFAKLVSSPKRVFYWPSLVLLWAFLIISIAAAFLLLASVFFRRPLDLPKLLEREPTPLVQRVDQHAEAFQKEKDLLGRLEMGLQPDFVKGLFGPPNFSRVIKGKKIGTYDKYKFDSFWLQIVYDKNGALIYYSVTPRTNAFKPELPLMQDKMYLGDITYAQFEDEPELIRNWMGNHGVYWERYNHWSNAAGNVYYYLAFTSEGILYNESGTIGEMDDDFNDHLFSEIPENKRLEIQSLRAVQMPNCFAISQVRDTNDEELITSDVRIGPEP